MQDRPASARGPWAIRTGANTNDPPIEHHDTHRGIRCQTGASCAFSRALFGDAVGKNLAMRALFDGPKNTAQTDESFLIRGESGTGKNCSPKRFMKPARETMGHLWYSIAVAPSFIDLEFFGHEKGAFSGADAVCMGLIQAAP